MKKMVALLLVVCVMCSMLIVTASAAELRLTYRAETVTTRAANVRKYPNTNTASPSFVMKCVKARILTMCQQQDLK